MAILDKVQKLLRLGESSNVNEAATAMALAHELMLQHKITAADIASTAGDLEQHETIIEMPVPTGKQNRINWHGQLALALARNMQCGVFWRKNTLRIVGAISDAETVLYLQQYLVQELQRLAAEAWSKEVCVNATSGKTWKNNFYVGAIETIGRRLKESTKTVEHHATSTSLVVLRNQEQEVKNYLEQIVKVAPSKLTHSQYDHLARLAGKKAAESISLHGGKGLAAPKERLTK